MKIPYFLIGLRAKYHSGSQGVNDGRSELGLFQLAEVTRVLVGLGKADVAAARPVHVLPAGV
jgi:hypothetical protein